MTNEIQIFENKEFGEVRTIIINDVPYFVGKDVAEILGYTNTPKAIRDHIDDEDKLTERIVLSGQNREVIFINESGLYSLIIGSKLPAAKKFKRWVTSEVLPSIRKTGQYNISQKSDSYMIDDPIQRAERWIEEEKERRTLRATIEEQKPLVEYAEHIQASQDVIDMKSMAKIASKNGVKIGRNKLFSFLRDRKILDKDNIPFANYMDREWFEVVESTYTCFSGEVKINNTTLVKPKGQIGIVKQLRKYYLGE
jgi:anti-repressor protein